MQNHVRVPPDDDAVVPCFRDFPQYFPLAHEHFRMPPRIIRRLAETVPVSQLVMAPAVPVYHPADVFRVQSLLVCQGLDDFPVIIVPAQQVRKPLAQFPAAAAELAADSNDSDPHAAQTPLYG